MVSDQGDHVRGMALLEEAEQATRAVDPVEAPHAALFVGSALCFQGVVAQRAGDLATTMARFLAAIPFLRAPGGDRRLGMVLGEIGVLLVAIVLLRLLPLGVTGRLRQG